MDLDGIEFDERRLALHVAFPLLLGGGAMANTTNEQPFNDEMGEDRIYGMA